jgi:hypothetical protein
MAKPIKVNQNKRGRPATGRDPVSAVRLPTALTVAVDRWAAKHNVNRSESIRRLVELGLTIKTSDRPGSNPGRKLRAQELATRTIEKIADASASPEEQTQRRRRLVKGPEEFREARIDRPKAKGK